MSLKKDESVGVGEGSRGGERVADERRAKVLALLQDRATVGRILVRGVIWEGGGVGRVHRRRRLKGVEQEVDVETRGSSKGHVRVVKDQEKHRKKKH